ncbi:MAG: hypothetical protein WKF41_02405 [Gaiellaceae bacterium]
MTLSRQNILGIGLATAVLTAVALAAANFVGDGENGGAGAFAITLVASLIVAGALFGWAIPRIERPARMGLIVGALGLLSIAAYWTGLPYVLGPAAIVLGLLGRTRIDGKGVATAAVVLGVLATVGGIAAMIGDQAF